MSLHRKGENSMENATEPRKDSFVYIVSMGVTVAVVIWGLFSPDSFGAAAKGIFAFLTDYYGWGLYADHELLRDISYFSEFDSLRET